MTCRELVDFLMDYESNELPELVRSEFERHLKLCPPCVAYLNTYRHTITMAKDACCESADELCGAVPEELIQAIIEAQAKDRS